MNLGGHYALPLGLKRSFEEKVSDLVPYFETILRAGLTLIGICLGLKNSARSYGCYYVLELILMEFLNLK